MFHETSEVFNGNALFPALKGTARHREDTAESPEDFFFLGVSEKTAKCLMLGRIRYRIRYLALFRRYMKRLGIPISRDIAGKAWAGCNPSAFFDRETGCWYNLLMKEYAGRHGNCLCKGVRTVHLKSLDVKVLAVNYKVLSELSNMPILKYFSFLSYPSRRELSGYLWELRDK